MNYGQIVNILGKRQIKIKIKKYILQQNKVQQLYQLIIDHLHLLVHGDNLEKVKKKKKKTIQKRKRFANRSSRNSTKYKLQPKRMEQNSSFRTDNIKFINKPLSNFDLMEWVKKLGIKNFRGIYSRDSRCRCSRFSSCSRCSRCSRCISCSRCSRCSRCSN